MIWHTCPLPGNGNRFFTFSFERTFKTIYKTLLPFFHILLTSTNVLTARNEMSAILDFCRYACHVTTGVTQYFWSRQTLTILHSKLYPVCPSKYHARSLKTFKTSTNQYLVSNEYFYMVNPCCDVTKTTVNEIKNISKMADISLLQEQSKIWRIEQLLYGFRVWMAWSKHEGMLRELRKALFLKVKKSAFLNSSNIHKCLDQAIQTRKP